MGASFPATLLCVRLLLLLLSLLLGPALLVSEASAHFSSGLYSHRRADCASRVDPIGAVFYGPPDGTLGNNVASAVNHVQAHAGWGPAWTSAGQWFATHGYCVYWDGEVASGPAWTTRHHMRVRRTYHADQGLRYATVGTPHYETKESCGHVVRRTINGISGFDIGRRRLYQAMQAGNHTTFYEYWGNTQPFVQCNGDVANANGNVRFFFIPAWWH